MRKLAIRGHETRGREVIEIFEMLGGKTFIKLTGTATRCGYCINQNGYIGYVKSGCSNDNVIQYTLEEFLKKYPYKVGDKVIINYCKDDVYTISEMNWDGERIVYKIRDRDGNIVNSVWWESELLPYKEKSKKLYKEENFAECIENTIQECLFGKKETKKKDISGAIIDRFICLEGYDFYDDKGNVINTKEITMKKKKPQYPKNYEECCKVLNLNNNLLLTYNDFTLETPYDDNLLILLGIFRQLKICRDAYWKIAGEQMGLGEPWEPDWKDFSTQKYTISVDKDKIITSTRTTGSRMLVFPTAEMRDVFYKNFKKLIEQCKELI